VCTRSKLWLRGTGTRKIALQVDLDRKTVQRYIAAATAAGLQRGPGEDALHDELMAKVCEHARPHRPDGHGESWAALRANHDQLKTWLVDGGLTSVKATELLCRRGVAVPERTVHRYALKVLGVGRSARSRPQPSPTRETRPPRSSGFATEGLARYAEGHCQPGLKHGTTQLGKVR